MSEDTAICGERFSRYRLPGNPPPSFQKVVQAIEKHSRKKHLNKAAVRKLAEKVDKYYNRGKGDDLFRLLMNHRVLQVTAAGLRFDSIAAAGVLGVCAGVPTEEAEDEYLEELLESDARKTIVIEVDMEDEPQSEAATSVEAKTAKGPTPQALPTAPTGPTSEEHLMRIEEASAATDTLIRELDALEARISQESIT